MNIRGVKIGMLVLLFYTSFLSFSQQEVSENLKENDENLEQFENHFFNALTYKATQNYARAITELDKCKQFEISDAAIDFELSKNYYYSSSYQDALYYINLALDEDPNEYWFLAHKKAIYLAMYDYKKAIEVQEQLIVLKPDLQEDLVLLYIQSRDYKKASKLITELKKSGWSGSRLKRYEAITKKYMNPTVLKDDKLNTPPKNSLSSLKKTYEEKHEYNILIKILELEFTAKSYDSILYYCNSGLDYYPAQPNLYLFKGKALVLKEDYKVAKEVLEEGLDYLVDTPKIEIEFLENIAICYEKMNQKEQFSKTNIQIELLKQKL